MEPSLLYSPLSPSYRVIVKFDVSSHAPGAGRAGRRQCAPASPGFFVQPIRTVIDMFIYNQLYE